MEDKQIPIEKLFEKTGSLYKLVILASRRALELNAGSPQLVEQAQVRVLQTALREIAEDKVAYKIKTDKK